VEPETDYAEVRLRSCDECRRLWLDAAERWRALLTIDDSVGLFYPECAHREFDDH